MTAGALNEQGQQRLEWRRRLVDAVLKREFDDETLIAMVMAGFDQAHEDGISDAADLCRDVAAGAPDAVRVAGILEKSLRSLIRLNREQHAFYVTLPEPHKALTGDAAKS